MSDTARFLGEKLNEKVIVLTGSIVPFGHDASDASFNVGYATAAAQQLSPGVYIAMNGQIFLWNDVQKNLDTNTFERL